MLHHDNKKSIYQTHKAKRKYRYNFTDAQSNKWKFLSLKNIFDNK